MTAVKRRAILSVYDKTGLIELGTGLAGLGFELVASGGTARKLIGAGLTVTEVSDATGHPEILGGRVKTLHPAVHGGILARRTDDHLSELAEHGIGPVDVVVCNLYPFVKTVSGGAVEAEAVEQIDIGGVTLLRAAAKNFESVAVVCDPDDYSGALELLGNDDVEQARLDRRKLALKAFQHTAAYDAAIATWLDKAVNPDDALPSAIHLSCERVQTLRYGENPHQAAAVYRWTHQPPAFEMIRGAKALSYNNIVDLEATWSMTTAFERTAVAIVKHTNPCGLAVGETPVEAFHKALACDPVSAFGSIIACNRPVDADFVKAWGKLFVEVVIAPSFTEEAIKRLRKRKKNCRVLVPQLAGDNPFVIKGTRDGLLVQTTDLSGGDDSGWTVATERQPTEQERADLAFGWLAVKHVKSNAIVIARDGAMIGVGQGQSNRVEAVAHSVAQAKSVLAADNEAAALAAENLALASDAFFPFPDGVETAAANGVTAIVQPGGSIRDDAVIEAANRLGIAMMFTGERHFLH